MEKVVKAFNELSLEELVEIYQLRVAVFVVEQKCPYQEIDDLDKYAVHICFRENGKIQAYCRVIPQGVLSDNVHIGRVISIKRRCGLILNICLSSYIPNKRDRDNNNGA